MSNAVTNREQLRDIRRRMLSHEISYNQAKTEAQPIIDVDNINNTARLLAKKHKVRASKLSFAAIMR